MRMKVRGEYLRVKIPDFNEMESASMGEFSVLKGVPGIYLLFNEEELIYVGRGNDIGGRVSHHRSIHAGNKIFNKVYYFKTSLNWEQKFLASVYNELYAPKYLGNVLGDKIWRKDALSLEEPKNFYKDSKTKEIIRQGCRILRPSEFKVLVDGVKRDKFKIMLKTMLFTGMKYVELQRFRKLPNWFDGEVIHMPRLKLPHRKRHQEARTIRLSYEGRKTVREFLEFDRNFPTYQTWSENLACWAYNVGIFGATKQKRPRDGKYDGQRYKCPGLTAKTLRKTWEAWLMYYYPKNVPDIQASQGHQLANTLRRRYYQLPFTDKDKEEMKELVDGWI